MQMLVLNEAMEDHALCIYEWMMYQAAIAKHANFPHANCKPINCYVQCTCVIFLGRYSPPGTLACCLPSNSIGEQQKIILTFK